MKWILRKAGIVFLILFCTYGWFDISLRVFVYLAHRDVFLSTIFNLCAIVICLVLDKIQTFAFIYLYAERNQGKYIRLKKVLYFLDLDGASMKSIFYLFYVLVLILSALLGTGRFTVSSEFNEYLESVTPGLLILIAMDQFLQQIFKDVRIHADILRGNLKSQKQM